MRRGWVLALALVLGASASGCRRRPTQLVVVVDTDLPRDSYGCFGLLVSRVEGNVVEAGATRRFLPRPDASPPFSFAVTPPDGRATARVEVAVEALPACEDPAEGARVVRRAARTGFVPEQSLRLALFLPASCGDGCTVTESCPSIGPDCEMVPTIEPTELVPFVPDDAGPSPDAAVERVDGGPAPPCDAVVADTYLLDLWEPPTAVAGRQLSAGFTVVSSNGGSNSVSEAVGDSSAILNDETGFSTASAASALAMHGLAGTDDVFVVATIGTDVLHWRRGAGAMLAATRVGAGALRPGLSATSLGGETLFAVEQGGALALRRAPSGTPVDIATTELREVALAPSGTGGALVALAQGAAPDQCDVDVVDEGGVRQTTIAAPTGTGPCESVGVASVASGQIVLAFVAAGTLWYRHIDAGTSTVGGSMSLGPALAGHVGVWPDGSGGFRVVWRGGTEELRSVAVSALDVQGRTSCIGDASSTAVDYGRVTSARAGSTTMVVLSGGGRGGAGALYTTLTD